MKRIIFTSIFLLLAPVLCHGFQYEYALPSYDSGWHPISPGEKINVNHSLGGNTDNYVIDLQSRDEFGKRVHNKYYGVKFNATSGLSRGIMWSLIDSTWIQISRASDDYTNDDFRIRIWVLSGADYDSGWLPYAQNQVRTLYHNLEGDPDEYVVYMESLLEAGPYFYPPTIKHQQFFGGTSEIDTEGTFWRGCQWADLNSSSIRVARLRHDYLSDKVRIRIWRVKSPDWDSGWQDIAQGESLKLPTSNIAPYSDNSIYLEFKDTDNQSGVNAIYFGGIESINNANLGAYIESITGSHVTVHRNIHDNVADKIRVRIWSCKKPAYESDWVYLQKGSNIVLPHGLKGGDPGNYIVHLVAKSISNKIHNQFEGETTTYQNGTWREYGFHWSNLSTDTITLHRADDDIEASYLKARIWIPPRADVDTDWVFLPDGDMEYYFPDLGGDPKDYFIYMERRILSSNRTNYHIGGDSYFYNGEPKSDGFWWSGLTTHSIGLSHANQYNEVRVRIWKNGEKFQLANLTNPPPGDLYEFNYEHILDGPDYIYGLQFGTDTYITNGSIGGYISGTTSDVFVGAYYRRTKTPNLLFMYNYSLHYNYNTHRDRAIRLFGWNISWEPKQKIPVTPSHFPWALFLPAILTAK